MGFRLEQDCLPVLPSPDYSLTHTLPAPWMSVALDKNSLSEEGAPLGEGDIHYQLCLVCMGPFHHHSHSVKCQAMAQPWAHTLQSLSVWEGA